MLEKVHAPQRIVQQITKKDTDSPSVHTDKDCLFVGLFHNMIHCRLHSVHDILRALAFFNLESRVAQLPLLDHKMIILIFGRRHAVTFFGSPADLIQAFQRLVGYSEIEKPLDGLLTSFQR